MNIKTIKIYIEIVIQYYIQYLLLFTCTHDLECFEEYFISIMISSKMMGIDLFSGAGGLSLGAAWAGIDIQVAVEIDPYSSETYKYNHPKTQLINKDIRKITTFNVKNSGPIVLFGGPPCQGYSTSNQKTRHIDNQNNWYFLEVIRFAKLINPDWVLIENVKGIKETEKGFFLDRIICELDKLGYTTSCWQLNAADYSVPQIRHRFFIVGSLHGILLHPPKVTSKKHITVREAISDLPELDNGASCSLLPYKCEPFYEYAKKMRGELDVTTNHIVSKNSAHIIERYKHISQGRNWNSIPSHLLNTYTDVTKCHTGIYRRLVEDEPSVVIGNYRKNMLIHPTQNRGLSVREAARLQSFPDWYVFKGSIGFQQQQVGNAVPPLLAKSVFNEILGAN